jgi:hypothetical protein
MYEIQLSLSKALEIFTDSGNPRRNPNFLQALDSLADFGDKCGLQQCLQSSKILADIEILTDSENMTCQAITNEVVEAGTANSSKRPC